MGIMSFFSTTCETRELHQDPELRTRYYRNNFKQCLEAMQRYADANALEVKNVNQEHGEIYLLGPGYDLIMTITQTSPIESGVDMKINYFTVSGLGRPKRRAMEIYQFLEKQLNFKGVSLHP